MSRRTPGAESGAIRWWIYRDYLRPTRFGEPGRVGIVWAVRPIVGRGTSRRTVGAATYFATRRRAFAYVATQARRIYGLRRLPRNQKAES